MFADYHPHTRGESPSLSLSAVCVSLNPGTLAGRACVIPRRSRPGPGRGRYQVPRSSHTTHSQHKVYHSSVLARRGGEAEEERARPRRGGSQVRDRGAQWPPVLRSPSAVAARRLRAAAQRVERGTGGAASGRGAILESPVVCPSRAAQPSAEVTSHPPALDGLACDRAIVPRLGGCDTSVSGGASSPSALVAR